VYDYRHMNTFDTSTLVTLGKSLLTFLNNVAVPVLFAIAFVVFLWGVFKAYIYSRGDAAEVSKGHQFILWGLVGFFVMLSVWGLVNIISGTFPNLSNQNAPRPPTIWGSTSSSSNTPLPVNTI